MKAFRTEAPSISAVTVVDRKIDDVLNHLRMILEEEDRGTVTIEIVQIASEEIDSLPEFEGY